MTDFIKVLIIVITVAVDVALTAEHLHAVHLTSGRTTDQVDQV